MDTDSSRYLEDYYDSQNIFSYLNSEEYFKDLKKVLDEPTKSRADKLKEKIVKTLNVDIRKVEKKTNQPKAKKIDDFFELVVLKMIRRFFD